MTLETVPGRTGSPSNTDLAVTLSEINSRLDTHDGNYTRLSVSVDTICSKLDALNSTLATRGRITSSDFRAWIVTGFAGITLLGTFLALFINQQTAPLAANIASVGQHVGSMATELRDLDGTTAELGNRLDRVEGIAELGARDRSELRSSIAKIEAVQMERAAWIGQLRSDEVRSTAEREELRARLERQATMLSAHTMAITRLDAGVVEIETQFRGVGEIINLLWSRAISDISRLWTRVYREPYPDTDYAPQIGRHLQMPSN
jgi:hypothetical protein